MLAEGVLLTCNAISSAVPCIDQLPAGCVLAVRGHLKCVGHHVRVSLGGQRQQNRLLFVAASWIEKKISVEILSNTIDLPLATWEAQNRQPEINNIRSKSPAENIRYFTSCINTNGYRI